MTSNSQKNQSQKSETQKPKPSKEKPVLDQITHKIDASGKILGRLSTEIANLLRGKGKVSFRPHLVVGDKVIVYNAQNIKVTGNKMTSKVYYRHTGYMGHLKSETMQDLFRKNPSEIIRRAVRGMLPKNKLQNKWLKNLTIYNGEMNGSK